MTKRQYIQYTIALFGLNKGLSMVLFPFVTGVTSVAMVVFLQQISKYRLCRAYYVTYSVTVTVSAVCVWSLREKIFALYLHKNSNHNSSALEYS